MFNKKRILITDCIENPSREGGVRHSLSRFLMRHGDYLAIALSLIIVMIFTIHPAFANNQYQNDVKSIVKSMIDIIGFIFKAVGVILGVYSVGQLILAFKNEDADSKSRASTQLVVSIALIAVPAIINNVGVLKDWAK